MGRLKTLPPRIASLRSTLGHLEGDVRATDKRRNALSPYRAWYRTARWQHLRHAILLRDLYTCQMCGKVSSTGMTIDHIKPHRGSEALFWAEDNLQVLCTSPCHVKHKQALEQAMPKGVWD